MDNRSLHEPWDHQTIPSGFQDLDCFTRGWHPGDLVAVVSADPDALLAMALVVACSAAARTPTALCLRRCATDDAARRMVASCAGLFPYPVHHSEADRALLARASQQVGALPLYLDDGPLREPTGLVLRCLRLHAERSLGMVLIEPEMPVRDVGRSLSRWFHQLRFLTHGLRLPVLLLLPETDACRQPHAAHLDPTPLTLVSRSVDILLRLACTAHHLDGDPASIAQLHVLKNRHGPTGTVNLRWDPCTLRLSLLAPWTSAGQSHSPPPAARGVAPDAVVS